MLIGLFAHLSRYFITIEVSKRVLNDPNLTERSSRYLTVHGTHPRVGGWSIYQDKGNRDNAAGDMASSRGYT